MRHFPPALSNRRIHPSVRQLDEVTLAEARPLIHTLFGAVVVVLFVACANLAGLLLVRVLRRRREISVRMALGASMASILRQPLLEVMLLSVGGGVLGLALANFMLRFGSVFFLKLCPVSVRLLWTGEWSAWESVLLCLQDFFASSFRV